MKCTMRIPPLRRSSSECALERSHNVLLPNVQVAHRRGNIGVTHGN